MKNILFLLFTIVSLNVSGQTTTTLSDGNTILRGWGSGSKLEIPITLGIWDNNVRVHSKYDTTVLYNGTGNCNHKFVNERQPISNISCAVIHGAAGCPDTWQHYKSICTICLKHIEIKETRWVEPIKDEYQEAIERLKKIQN